ncbi:MAG: hypothetical protein WCF16_01670 [Alphaproteobacteria bacterium]
MRRTAALGAVAGMISVLTFHQAMWAVIWLWSAGGFPRPYHLFPYPPLGLIDVVLLFLSGAVWGTVAAFAIERFVHRQPIETGLLVGSAATLLHPIALQWLVLQPLSGGAPLPARIIDNVFLPALVPHIAINMAWGIGVGLIYPALVRRAGALGTR